MRKLICMLITLVMCLSIVAPAYAAGNEFVPSITYKDGPNAQDAEMDGEDVSGCVVVTSIKEAEEKTTDIIQEERDLLLEVYEKLSNGEMTLPLEDDYVIRELVDVSFEYMDCREIESHGEKDLKLKQEGVTLTVDFDYKVDKGEELHVLTYIDGEWVFVENVTINDNGTVTVVFEDICPVVFCVEKNAAVIPPKTGDEIGSNMVLYITLMAVSLAAIVVLISKQKKTAH